MIYRLTHTTSYQYVGMVSLSHHVLRLQPRDLPRQRCLQTELHVEPRPDVLSNYRDYFGNNVTFVTIEGSHKSLVISSQSQVEVTAPARSRPSQTPAWETARDISLAGEGERFLQAHEFIYSSPLIKRQPEFASYASGSFPAGRRCSRPSSI